MFEPIKFTYKLLRVSSWIISCTALVTTGFTYIYVCVHVLDAKTLGRCLKSYSDITHNERTRYFFHSEDNNLHATSYNSIGHSWTILS